jgi:hypothetical protein
MKDSLGERRVVPFGGVEASSFMSCLNLMGANQIHESLSIRVARPCQSERWNLLPRDKIQDKGQDVTMAIMDGQLW